MNRPAIAVFSGPTATIQNTAPLVTSNQARAKFGLPEIVGLESDLLRPQRLAAPVRVYIEAYTAHPLEADASELYAEPDGYVDEAGEFHEDRQSPGDRPVYEATLRPEDGLYMLPYMARRSDGAPWEDASWEKGAPAEKARQTFFPDGKRLFEEIDRFAVDRQGVNGILSRKADFSFVRAAPSGGYTHGLRADLRTDLGEGDIPEEKRGVDFFYYYPPELARSPARATLATIANVVQSTLAHGPFDGAIWLEGSPGIEETMYWLSLVIDTSIPICGNAAQRPHGTLSADGDSNIVDSVDYILSRSWASSDGADAVGPVLVQDGQLFAARDVQKGDARPGGYVTTGGHGGIVGSVGKGAPVRITYSPQAKHTARSTVNLSQVPRVVAGVVGSAGDVGRCDVRVKNDHGELDPAAIPNVALCKSARYAMADFDGPADAEVEVLARIASNLERDPLSGFVLEGNAPFGRADESLTRALRQAVFSGMPVVRVGRGNADGFVSEKGEELFIGGSNLTATKARLLLIASLLKFGALPPARDPRAPSAAERAAILDALMRYREVFDTH